MIKLDEDILISVTKEDIENGIPRQPNCCPIALAVCRAIGLNSADCLLEVDGDINFYPWDVWIKNAWLMPFVVAFDREELVFPFNFTITISNREPDDYFGE